MADLIDEIKERAVIKEPAYNLIECIKIDKDFWRSEDEEMTPEEIDELIDEIKTSFRDNVRYGDDKKLNIIRKYVEESKNSVDTADEEYEEYFYEFYEDNIVYPFHWENKLYLILPDELVAIYEEFINSPDFEAGRTRNAELLKYGTALVNLYGVCEVKQFIEVWNTHHKEKLTNYAEILEILEKIGKTNYCYFFFDECLCADGVWLNMYRDNLLEQVEDLEYYMPLKSVIALHAKENYYMEIPGAKEMSEFLSQYISYDSNYSSENIESNEQIESRRDLINSQISWACKRIQRPAFIRKDLGLAGINFFDDSEAIEKFEKLFVTLRENTHIWEFRGLTPYQHKLQNNKTLPKFNLLEEDDTMKDNSKDDLTGSRKNKKKKRKK